MYHTKPDESFEQAASCRAFYILGLPGQQWSETAVVSFHA